MREKLKEIAGVRARFRGRFQRFGEAVVRFRLNGRLRSKPVRTLVLTDLTDDRDRPLSDHLWFRVGKQLDELALRAGDRVEFTATVERYTKRRRDEFDDGYYVEEDYCLKRPCKMVKLGVHDDEGRGLLFADLKEKEAKQPI